MAVIRTSGLTKYYGKARGIENLDLEIAENDIYAFIGPNGSGKSTTIRTLLGLIKPTSGSASVLGLDICKDKVEILKQVGYMPSEAIFYGDMKVSEIVQLSAKLRRADCAVRAKELCERLALDTGKKIRSLSLGNRKKVGIVCAFQHDVPLYILDEPTSGLDPLMQKEFFEILTERNKAGATVFLSSHVLSELQRYCLHAAIIRDGRLVKSGRVEELSKTAARRVTLHGISTPPPLPGLCDVLSSSDSVSFLYTGEIKELLSALNGLDLTDLSITEPDIEEVFMHYFAKEDEKA